VDPVDMAPDPVPAPLLSVLDEPAPLDPDPEPPELQRPPCLPPAAPSAAAAADASWLSVASFAWSIRNGSSLSMNGRVERRLDAGPALRDLTTKHQTSGTRRRPLCMLHPLPHGNKKALVLHTCCRTPSSSRGIATARHAAMLHAARHVIECPAQRARGTGKFKQLNCTTATQHRGSGGCGRTHCALDAPRLRSARWSDAIEDLLCHIQQLMDCAGRRACEHAKPGRLGCSRSHASGALRHRRAAIVPEHCRRRALEQAQPGQGGPSNKDVQLVLLVAAKTVSIQRLPVWQQTKKLRTRAVHS